MSMYLDSRLLFSDLVYLSVYVAELSFNSDQLFLFFNYFSYLSLGRLIYLYIFIYDGIQYNIMNIVEDTKLTQLFLRKSLSEKRKSQYETTLKEVYKLTNKTPTKLIIEAKDEEQPYLHNGVPRIRDMEDRRITEYYYNYYDSLRNRELTNSTIDSKLKTFRAFYNEYDVKLPKNINLQITKKIIREGDIPNIDDIRLAVENATTLRNRAIITFMATSGIRSDDVRTFKVSDFTKATKRYHNSDSIEDLLDDRRIKEVIPCWYFKPSKTSRLGNICMTFNTPEASNFIMTYLKSRNDLREDDYIFLSQYHDGLEASGVISMYKDLNDRIFGKDEEGKRFFHGHAMRKFFRSTVAHNTSDYNKSKILMGHSISKIDLAYEEINEEIMRQFYMPLIPHLSIKETKVKTIKDDDFIMLEEELAQKEEKQVELEDRLAVTEEQNRKIMKLLNQRV
nr:tyrosine-type recombinase/integrase [Methanobrevibacter arboriphilus]